VGALDPAIELRGSAIDLGVTNAFIFDVPMELGLELMAIVRPDFLDAEGKFFDDVVDKVDRIGLHVLIIDLEHPDPGCIVDSRILEPTDFLAVQASEGEELDVHLDVMAWNLLVVALGVDFAHTRSARQSANAIAAQNAGYASVGDFNAVITR
jgi:hypothetical protein